MTGGNGRSSCTASRASTKRVPATTARRPSPRRRCGPATSRSCWRSGRSTRSTTRSPGAPIGGGRFQQDPFPGNIIPPALINPVAKKVLEYIPLPLTAGRSDGTNNFQNPGLPEEIKYASNTIRVDHVVSNKQRVFGRVSWYDRNSNYNNYFGNLSTGEWFKFVSRQAAFDHVYVMNASTVLNMRYGYNWFVRGTDSNPDNHGFDLTSLGFPAAYQAGIPDDIRRFPRFDITGYQGTAIGGEERPNESHSFMATLNKTAGAHSVKGGLEYRRYREPDRFFANNQTGQFNFDATWTRGPLDNSPVAPGLLGQSFASFLLGIPSSGSVVRAASLRRVVHDVGLLRAGRLENRFAPHREPGSPVRARGAADRAGQSQRPRLRRGCRAADRGGGQGGLRAQSDARSAGEPVQRSRGLDVPRRRRRAERAVFDAEEQLHAAARPGLQHRRQDLAAGRLRRVLRLPRPAPRGRDSERVQPDHEHGAEPRQRPDLHRDAVQSVPGRHPGARRRRRSARRRSWARASRSSIPIRSRRGCSAGRSASSASCRDAGSPRCRMSATSARISRRTGT